MLLSLISFIKQKKSYIRYGLIFLFFYLLLGLYQKIRVVEYLHTVAKDRGHTPSRILTRPTIGNLVLWKGLYEYNGHYYPDAYRIGFFSSRKFFPGEKIVKFNIKKKFPHLKNDTVLYKDIQRFSYFSNGYIVLHPQYPHFIADMRYTLLPHKLDFLWGIKIDLESPQNHAQYLDLDSYTPQKKQLFFKMLWSSSN